MKWLCKLFGHSFSKHIGAHACWTATITYTCRRCGYVEKYLGMTRILPKEEVIGDKLN